MHNRKQKNSSQKIFPLFSMMNRRDKVFRNFFSLPLIGRILKSARNKTAYKLYRRFWSEIIIIKKKSIKRQLRTKHFFPSLVNVFSRLLERFAYLADCESWAKWSVLSPTNETMCKNALWARVYLYGVWNIHAQFTLKVCHTGRPKTKGGWRSQESIMFWFYY